MRNLQINDIFTVAKILSKVSRGAVSQIANAADGKVSESELGITLISSLFTEAEVEVKTWLADLMGIPAEDFGQLPAVELLNAVDELRQKEDIKDFFARASQLAGTLTRGKAS